MSCIIIAAVIITPVGVYGPPFLIENCINKLTLFYYALMHYIIAENKLKVSDLASIMLAATNPCKILMIPNRYNALSLCLLLLHLSNG